MNICLYGSGSNNLSQKYQLKGYELGQKLALLEHKLVFGAGNNGMMGSVARAFHDNNGKILGISPKWMNKFEEIYPDCDEVIYTDSMDERKNLFLENADVFIVSPGGIGTLDEFFEILALKKLNVHNKAIILLNLYNFYDTLVDMLRSMEKEGVIYEDYFSLFEIINTVDEAIDFIRNLD